MADSVQSPPLGPVGPMLALGEASGVVRNPDKLAGLN